jgi:hypothetical protein
MLLAFDRIVVSKFLDRGLKNDAIFYLITVIEYISLMDKCIGVDKKNLILRIKILSESMIIRMLGT